MLLWNENKLLSDKIKVLDIVEFLRAKDIRTAIRWCKKMGISILKIGGEKCVNLIDFNLAVDRPFILSLRERYPECWKELYDAYKRNDYITIMELEFKKAPSAKGKFVAPGPKGDAFLKEINKTTRQNV